MYFNFAAVKHVRSEENLESINSSKSMEEPFERTISRLYELTSIDFN